MTQAQGQILGSGENCANRASREKNWDELSIPEQMERMRGQVKLMQRRQEWHDMGLENLLNHEHSNGRLVVPLTNRNSDYSDSSRVRGDDWF